MRNKKITAAVIVMASAAATTVFSLVVHRSSGTNDKANDSLSSLHATIENGIVEQTDNVDEQISSYSSNFNTNSVYDSAEIAEGEYVQFAKGSVVILKDGDMSAVCDEELINATDGIPISNGENIQNYKLYVITEDGDGLYSLSDSEFYVKGGYEISESNKE